MFSELAQDAASRVEVKKSVFLGLVAPVETAAQADEIISRVRKEHYSARHHCTAMILGDQGDIQRSNDDGEPSGTAGAPMLAALRHRGLTNVVAVVTRYFGGTLLGTGGLIRAYTDAVNQALETAAIVSYEPANGYLLTTDYATLGDFEQVLRSWLAANPAKLARVDYDPAPEFSIIVSNRVEESLHTMLAPWLDRGVEVSDLGATKIAVSNRSTPR
jgi:uncharacterized YigZ family protein